MAAVGPEQAPRHRRVVQQVLGRGLGTECDGGERVGPDVDDREKEIARLVELGATRHADHAEYGHTWTVMADPESNDICVAQQPTS